MDFNKSKVKWISDYYGNPTAYYPLKVPGVTTVIQEMIPDPTWDEFVKEVGEEKANKIINDAWNRGKAMHLFIENYTKEFSKTKDKQIALQHSQLISPNLLIKDNIPLDKIDKGREMFLNFYYSDYSTLYEDLIGSELSLYSPILFYRGKTDIFYNEKGVGRVVTDFKTSSKPIEKGSIKELKYKRQLGGYALALEHMLKDKNITINKASILVVQTKSTDIQEIFCVNKELEEQKQEFKTLITEYHIKHDQSYLIDGFNK